MQQKTPYLCFEKEKNLGTGRLDSRSKYEMIKNVYIFKAIKRFLGTHES